jgi:hypothetical protein
LENAYYATLEGRGPVGKEQDRSQKEAASLTEKRLTVYKPSKL